MTNTTLLTLRDDEIETLGHRMCWRYKHSTDPNHSSTYTFNRTTLLDFARVVLTKWGTQQPNMGQVSTQWLAEMIMSDCGCSKQNKLLLDRIIERISQYESANAAPQHDIAYTTPIKSVPNLTEEYTKELDKLSQRNYELRMENAKLKATQSAPEVPDTMTTLHEIREKIVEKIDTLIASINEAHRAKDPVWKQGCFDAADCVNEEIKTMLTVLTGPGIPGNFITHRLAWREALELAKSNATTEADKSYWQHELNAFDRSFDRLRSIITISS